MTSSGLLFDKLRPDQVPVVRAQIAARYGAFGGALDRHTTLYRHGANPVHPLI